MFRSPGRLVTHLLVIVVAIILTAWAAPVIALEPVGSPQAVPAQTGDPATTIDIKLSKLTEAGLFSGSVLVAQNGKIILSKGYGMADLDHDVPNTPETKFRIGSITKQFTAAAIMLLQERGKLSVEDNVCKYVSDCPAAWKDVTLHHLLTHTSGIPDYVGFPETMKTITQLTGVHALIARFRDKPLNFKPGERWEYSNSGYALLGFVIEEVSGRSYRYFLVENIFTPLEMKNTDYDVNTEVVKHRATGYSSSTTKAPYIDMTIPYAAGGLYSTTEDLYRWDQSLHGDKLLSKKSRDAMSTPFAQMPMANDWHYGYGTMIGKQNDHRFIGHGGLIQGFVSFYAAYPDDNATVIILSNLERTSEEIIRDMIMKVLSGDL